jgi:hypothetical protein
VDAIFELLSKFLNPDFSESGAIYVGDLIIHLFRKATQSIQPILSQVLQALVIRMAQAKLPSFIEVSLSYSFCCGWLTLRSRWSYPSLTLSALGMRRKHWNFSALYKSHLELLLEVLLSWS